MNELPPVDLASESDFRLGTMLVQPSTRQFEAQTLQPRVMQVLVALARAQGAVVSRDELIARCWGGVVVGEDAITRVIGRLRPLFEERGEYALETIARVGYRLVPTALAAGASVDPAPTVEALQEIRDGPPRRRLPPIRRWLHPDVLGMAFVLFLMLLGIFSLRPLPRPLPNDARFAVLPFAALSTRNEASFLATSVADQIVSAINSNHFQAVTQTDADALRGSDRDAKIAELGVTLILDGSVRDDGTNLKISTRLDDPAHHAVLWSTEVEGPVGESERLQSQITRTIVYTLGCSKRALVPNHGLTDASLLGRYLRACDILMNQNLTPATIAEVFTDLDEVTSQAPDFLAGHEDLAQFSGLFAPYVPEHDAPTLREQATVEAHKALMLNPKSPFAHLALEFLLPPTQWAEREKLLRAGEGDPYWPSTSIFLAKLLVSVGRISDATSYFGLSAGSDLYIDTKPDNALNQVCMGQFEPALTYLKHEAALDADYLNSRGALFMGLSCAEHWTEAQDVFRSFPVGGDPAAQQQTALVASQVAAMATQAPDDIARAKSLALAAPTEDDLQAFRAVLSLALLGDLDDAFAIADRMTLTSRRLDTSHLFYRLAKPMRQDPRFIRFADRLGLVQYWRSTGVWPDYCKEPGLPYNCQAEAAKLAAK